ncbi:MAG: hypothetical protein H6570_01870 [Lewinellaceae bacterium]|nr:hypothetical protein [Lewinellaceae bacterium]
MRPSSQLSSTEGSSHVQLSSQATVLSAGCESTGASVSMTVTVCDTGSDWLPHSSVAVQVRVRV